MLQSRIYHGGGVGQGAGGGGFSSSSIHGFETLIWASSITLDLAQDDVFYLITDSGNLCTFQRPTNIHDGQKLTLILRNDGGGAGLISFSSSGFSFATDGAGVQWKPILNPQAYNFTVLNFSFDGYNNRFVLENQIPNFSPALYEPTNNKQCIRATDVAGVATLIQTGDLNTRSSGGSTFIKSDNDTSVIAGVLNANGTVFLNAGSSAFIENKSPVKMTSVKAGATQAGAGAVAGEVWETSGHATLPDHVLMLGA